MIIRLHNNDNTDYIDYEADTAEEIKELCKDRIRLANWINGWSELIKE